MRLKVGRRVWKIKWPNSRTVNTIGAVLMLVALLLDGPLNSAFTAWYERQAQSLIYSELEGRERKARQTLEVLSKQPVEAIKARKDLIAEGNRGTYYYVYNYNSLTYWNTNTSIPILSVGDRGERLVKMSNGYYLQIEIQTWQQTVICLMPISSNYPIENKYLQNIPLAYQWLKVRLEYDKEEESVGYAGVKDGKSIFYSRCVGMENTYFWIGWLFVLGVLLLLVQLHKRVLAYLRKRKWRDLGFVLALMSAIVVLPWKYYRLPHNLFKWPGFSAQLYGSSNWYSSLGDVVLLTISAGYLIWLATKVLEVLVLGKKLKWVIAVAGVWLSYKILGVWIYLTHSLVLDSLVNFDLSDIFNLNVYSLLGLLVMVIWGLVHFKLCMGMMALLREETRINKLLLGVVTPLVLWVVWMMMDGVEEPAHWWLGIYGLVSLWHWYLRENPAGVMRWPEGLAYFVLIGGLTSYMLYESLEQNANDEQVTVATRLMKERDAKAEFLFGGIAGRLKADVGLQQYFIYQGMGEHPEDLENKVQQMYFGGYLGKYEIKIQWFDQEGQGLNFENLKPLGFFKQFAEGEGTTILKDEIYYLPGSGRLGGYMMFVPIQFQDKVLGHLVVELRPKPFYEDSAYPELLLSESVQSESDRNNFSYAIYGDRILSSQRGQYEYNNLFNFAVPSDTLEWLDQELSGYRHVVYRLNQRNLVVVSRPNRGLVYGLTLLSSMLLLLAAYTLLLWGLIDGELNRRLWRGIRSRRLWRDLSFSSKILWTVSGFMSLGILVVGGATYWYITYQYNNDEISKLKRRSKFILNQLDEALHNKTRRETIQVSELQGVLKEIADAYQSDLNIYNTRGELIASTQEEIYAQQIVSSQMDPKAYLRFMKGLVTQYIQEEQIGKLHYNAAYIPMRNADGNIIGTLYVPYFMKEQNLKERLSAFLVTLINLYIGLFLGFVGLGALVSRGLTQPLVMISAHLRRTQLVGAQHPIEWKTQDELGQLISAYNDMVEALRESANQLAKTEREGAWKEMARQVAHEIKNPLTPMKLQLQRLQMAYQSGDKESFDKLFHRVSQILITQIDTLSEIADAFSEFAKMPQGEARRVAVGKELRGLAELFDTEQVKVSFKVDPSKEDCQIMIDPNQLHRVATNLIKNGMQAIEDGEEGKVEVEVMADEDKVVIRIQDNGKGIPEELRDKIFRPNFSTKSKGMGLGLAIVRGIVERNMGTIDFESEEGVGTTFFIRFPKAEA